MSTYKSWLEKTKKQINKTYDAQKKQTEDVYNRAINQTSSDAESSYRQNEVDRIFNEKKIAEVNANLGLTNSGLNRTQQTAVQLSHSNRDYEISKARQDAIDNIALEKAGKITEIENNRQNDLYEAKESYDSAVSSAKVKAAEKDKTTKYEFTDVLWYYTGTFDENENPIFRNSNGQTQAFGKGVNPYTGNIHDDAKSNGKYDSSKVYSDSPYQPNNIKGERLMRMKKSNLKKIKSFIIPKMMKYREI